MSFVIKYKIHRQTDSNPLFVYDSVNRKTPRNHDRETSSEKKSGCLNIVCLDIWSVIQSIILMTVIKVSVSRFL